MIAANVPVLDFKDGGVDVCILDTPGIGGRENIYITKQLEINWLTCSILIYLIDCTHLNDHVDAESLQTLREKDKGMLQLQFLQF